MKTGQEVWMKSELKNHFDTYWIEDMFIYSFRYTLGSKSFYPNVCIDFLTPCIPYLSIGSLEQMSIEIGECSLGEEQYLEEWREFKNRIDEELKKRQS